jgi:hypothetical protein
MTAGAAAQAGSLCEVKTLPYVSLAVHSWNAFSPYTSSTKSMVLLNTAFIVSACSIVDWVGGLKISASSSYTGVTQEQQL